MKQRKSKGFSNKQSVYVLKMIGGVVALSLSWNLAYGFGLEDTPRHFLSEHQKTIDQVESNIGGLYGLSENQIKKLLDVLLEPFLSSESINRVEAILLSDLRNIIESNPEKSNQSSWLSREEVLKQALAKILTPKEIAKKFTPEIQEMMVNKFLYSTKSRGQEIVKTFLLVLDNMGLIDPAFKSDIRALKLDLATGSEERFTMNNKMPFATLVLKDPSVLKLPHNRHLPQSLSTYTNEINKELKHISSILKSKNFSSEEKQLLIQFWQRTTFSYNVQLDLYSTAIPHPASMGSQTRQKMALRIVKKLNNMGVLHSRIQSKFADWKARSLISRCVSAFF